MQLVDGMPIAAPSVFCQCGPEALHSVDGQPGRQEALAAPWPSENQSMCVSPQLLVEKLVFRLELTSSLNSFSYGNKCVRCVSDNLRICKCSVI